MKPHHYAATAVALLLLGLAAWSCITSSPVPISEVAPSATAISTLPTTPAIATHRVVAFTDPGADPVYINLPVDALGVAWCKAWPQLVLTFDSTGARWWVNQENAPPDPSLLIDGQFLPFDPQPVCSQEAQ